MLSRPANEFTSFLFAPGNQTLCAEIKVDWEGNFKLRCWEETRKYFNDIVVEGLPQCYKGSVQYPAVMDLMVGSNQGMINEHNQVACS